MWDCLQAGCPSCHSASVKHWRNNLSERHLVTWFNLPKKRYVRVLDESRKPGGRVVSVLYQCEDVWDTGRLSCHPVRQLMSSNRNRSWLTCAVLLNWLPFCKTHRRQHSMQHLLSPPRLCFHHCLFVSRIMKTKVLGWFSRHSMESWHTSHGRNH